MPTDTAASSRTPSAAGWTAFAAAAPDLCGVVGADGRLERGNERFARAVGCEPAALIGRPVQSFVPRRERAHLAAALAACRAGDDGEAELHLAGANGALVRVRWRGSLLPGGALAVVGRPVVRAPRRPRPHRRLVAQATDLLGLHRPDGTWLWANAAAEPALGRAPEDLVGRALADLTHPADRRRLHAQALDLLRDGAADARVLCRLAVAGGRWRRFDLAFVAVHDAAGRLVRVQSAARRLVRWPRPSGTIARRRRRLRRGGPPRSAAS